MLEETQEYFELYEQHVRRSLGRGITYVIIEGLNLLSKLSLGLKVNEDFFEALLSACQSRRRVRTTRGTSNCDIRIHTGDPFAISVLSPFIIPVFLQ